MKLGLGGFLIVTLTFIVTSSPASAPNKRSSRPLRVALPSHSVSSTPIYMARSLGIFESLGFEPRDPRA